MACARRISTTPGDGSEGLDFLRKVSIIHGGEITRRLPSDIVMYHDSEIREKLFRCFDGHTTGVFLTG
jgi:hypothetical protein